MTPVRRALLAALAAAAIASTPVRATDWPTKPVTIYVTTAAGGNTDMMARMAADHLAATFGKPFVVENRPSAGGAQASGAVARSLARASGRIATLEDAGSNKDAFRPELHHQRRVGRRGDTARGEQDNGQSAIARDLPDQLVRGAHRPVVAVRAVVGGCASSVEGAHVHDPGHLCPVEGLVSIACGGSGVVGWRCPCRVNPGGGRCTQVADPGPRHPGVPKPRERRRRCVARW